MEYKKDGKIIAILTMMFLYAMIAFVTNLAAPIGVVWKNQPEIGNSNLLGMMGNFMNFFAYLFMGIPSGKLLIRIGYKKTAQLGIALGFFGVFIQFLSGFPIGIKGFIIYLIGAFVSGFAVCTLNSVVNPMLNLLGGGGNRGNQLNLIGGTLDSLSGTLTPMLVGALIGTVTLRTQMSTVNLVLYIAMSVFVIVFILLSFIPIKDPEVGKANKDTIFEKSPLSFRHFVLGIIAIFVYVGAETGIPGTLNFYISDTSPRGAGLLTNAAAIGGFMAGTYWFLMLVGRLIASFIANKVSSRIMIISTTFVGIMLMILAVFLSKNLIVNVPLFTGKSFKMTNIPLSALLIVFCGLCTSVMWTSIFNLSVEGLGKYTSQASGFFMMMVVGGGILPLIQNYIADHTGYMISYIVPIIALVYIFFYGLLGCKNVNRDIPVS